MSGFPRRLGSVRPGGGGLVRGLVLGLSLTLGVAACGKKASKSSPAAPKPGHVEAAFMKAAGATGVPVRFMMATAYL